MCQWDQRQALGIKKDHLGKWGPVTHHHGSFYAEPCNSCLENLVYLSLAISLQTKGYIQRKKTRAVWGRVLKYPCLCSFPENYGILCPKSPSRFDLLSSLLETQDLKQRQGVQGSPASKSLSDTEKSQLTIMRLGSRPVHAVACCSPCPEFPHIFSTKASGSWRSCGKQGGREAAARMPQCSDLIYLRRKLSGAGNVTADGWLHLLNLLRAGQGSFQRKGWHCQCWGPNSKSWLE